METLKMLSRLKDIHGEIGMPILTHDSPFGYTFAEKEKLPETFFSLLDSHRFKIASSSRKDYKISSESKDIVKKWREYLKNEFNIIYSNSILVNQYITYAPLFKDDLKTQLTDINTVLETVQPDSKGYHKPMFSITNIKNMTCLYSSCAIDMFNRHLVRNLSDLLLSNTNNISSPTKCPQEICVPGKHKVYREIAGGYGWRCDLCPVNYHKSTIGDNGCIPCHGRFSIDNGDRTACIDPYIDVYQTPIERTLFKISLSASCFGGFSTMATLVLFIKKRETPVVATADSKMSILHLFAILVIFIFSPVIEILHPSMEVCVGKTIITSTVFVFIVTIGFVKSQKLLKAFLSAVQVTENEVRKTVSWQILVILVCLIICTAINYITLKLETTISVLIIESQFQRVRYCSTAFHLNIMIGFVMLIQFACFIQAFRGRHLPNVMNDAMSFVYTSFTTLLMFIVMFVIVSFQKPVEKELYQQLTLIVNNLVIFIMLYGQKAFRILAYPHQNTRQYFREERLNDIRLQ
eukprot:TCONS_00022494-protein